MAGSFFTGTAVFERGKRQLDRNHLGGDLVDALTVPHRRRVGRVELGAKVLVLAVQLVKLHGEAPRGREMWLRPIGKSRAAATARQDRGLVRQTAVGQRARRSTTRRRGRAGCYGPAIKNMRRRP